MERGLLARTLHSGSKTSAELSVNNKQRIDDTLHNGQLMLPQDGAGRARQGGSQFVATLSIKLQLQTAFSTAIFFFADHQQQRRQQLLLWQQQQGPFGHGRLWHLVDQ